MMQTTSTGIANRGHGAAGRPDQTGPARSEEVLQFWFGSPGEAGYEAHRDAWFGGGETFDDEIRRRFSTLHRTASAGEMASWRDAPRSCLALILVLDQFPRNMFRGSARAFAADPMARAHACFAVAHGFDKEMPPVHRTFFYLPFEHSENLDDQRRAVELYGSCERHSGCEHSLNYALRHLKVIARFGRFPHRYQVLGRRSTPGEIAFLAGTERGF